MVEIILIFLIVGIIIGLLAGLLGIGGGIVIVPALVYMLPEIGLHKNYVMQVALGTSVACTFFSMLSSAFRHYKQKSIKFDIYLKIAPGLIIGGILGPIIAHVLDYNVLKNVFALMLFIVSLNMLIGSKTKKILNKDNINTEDENKIYYNNILFLFLSGLIVGMIASLMGIGGGILLLPLLTFMNIKMNNAVGTSAISGVTIGFIAIFGYAISGFNAVSKSDLYLGYIYLPAVVGISLTSIIFAQIGALWSKDIPQDILKKLLACILIFTAGKMFW